MTKQHAEVLSMATLQLCERDDENYIVTLRRPDGSLIAVLIPIEGTNKYADQCIEIGGPFGLNFISTGHYQ